MAIAGEAKAPVQEEQSSIRSVAGPTCFMCGSVGATIYENLSDRAFAAPGSWNVRRCANPKCGLWWLDPVPVQDDIWKAYRSYYTHAAPERPQDKPGIFRRVFRACMARMRACYLDDKYGYSTQERDWTDRLVSWLSCLLPQVADWDMSVMFLPARPGGSVLELGCGGGDLLCRLSALGWRAEGVDVDPNAVDNARRKGLNVKLGPVEALAYPAECFDAVIMVHVIEHVHNPRRLLQECYRILKPGGQLSLVTPNADSLLHRLFGRSWFPLEPPRHLHIFNIAAIKKLLEGAGFETVHPFTTIRDADGLVAASRSIRQTGRFTLGSAQPLWVRVCARILQVFEWLLTIVDPSAGEELTAVVRK
jgi:2-polyprenyl-3-methyl-5-hydroxy-6-metoxy-1,4-benzoquinol methylase